MWRLTRRWSEIEGRGWMICSGAEPFFLPGGPQGVLLVHGFTGSPADLLLLGRFLQARGCTVLGVRLAGHATSEEDLSRQTAEDWLDSVRDGAALLRGCTRTLSVVGHSLGGVLAFLLAMEQPLRRIVSLATPVDIAPERGADQLPPRSLCAGRYAPKRRRRMRDVPPAVNESYARMPLVSVHELFDVIARMKEHLGEVAQPTLIMHSKCDHTAAPESARYLYEHIASREKELVWLERSGHLLPLDVERQTVFEKTADFLARGGAR